MDELVKRRVVLSIENDQIGDGAFCSEVSKTLREIADMIDAGSAGRHDKESYRGDRGTLVLMSADDVTAVCIPYREPGNPRLLAGYVPDSA